MDATFSRLTHTCSMVELSSPWVDRYTTKKHFLYHFDIYLKDKQMSPRERKRYSIIYNCTCPDRYKHLTRIGFKHAFSYKGDGNVKVLIMDVNKVTKLTFWEWFRS